MGGVLVRDEMSWFSLGTINLDFLFGGQAMAGLGCHCTLLGTYRLNEQRTSQAIIFSALVDRLSKVLEIWIEHYCILSAIPMSRSARLD